MPRRDLLERTRLFALAILSFSRKAPQTKETQEAIEQLRKSANSIRSNYRAARRVGHEVNFKRSFTSPSKRPTSAWTGSSTWGTESFIMTQRFCRKHENSRQSWRPPIEPHDGIRTAWRPSRRVEDALPTYWPTLNF